MNDELKRKALALVLEAAETGDNSKWYAFIESRFPGGSCLMEAMQLALEREKVISEAAEEFIAALVKESAATAGEEG